MGLEIKHAGTRGMVSGQRHFSPAFPSVFRTLVWLWVIAFVFAMKPTAAQGSKQKTLRKEAPKSKTTAPAPIRRLTKTQSEVPAEAMERREHVIQQTRVGDTLQELLSRFGLANAERQLWTRSIQRNIGTWGMLPT